MKSNENKLAAPLIALTGVGPSLAEKLQKLGVFRVEDLLFLLPLRYEDRTRLHPIGSLKPGDRCMVSGEVSLAETVYRGRRSLLVRITDGTGQLTLRFFYFSRKQQAQFQRGVKLSCFGEVRAGPGGLEIIHPEYRLLAENEAPAISASLTPTYPTTEGMQQGRLRNLVMQAVNIMRQSPPAELISSRTREKFAMPELMEALLYIHMPPPDADTQSLRDGTHPCQQRLAFEELLAHHLSLRRIRQEARQEPALAMEGDSKLVQAFLSSLPFTLTDAQTRVIGEIAGDLQKPHPMLRLLQGDVGSGKTIVAAAACLQVIDNGYQAALMAPTELLAEQHLRSFSVWLQALGITPTWLTGSLRAADRRLALAAIADGGAKLAVGTHALFQEGVEFAGLGLVVIDEQHRFGVHQRMALREKGQSNNNNPHQLVMTATPIPRTLAMAAYADLDTSVIDELPPGRDPVRTVAMPDVRRGEVVARVQTACQAGQQAYWVCPLIEESEVLDYQAAEASYQMLCEALPDVRIGLVHGRMKSAQKDNAMQAFKNGDMQLLVATTVIEVGVDVPNASLMIIENAERMGLSQLHQLRGRVGRGHVQSHCVLLYKPPLNPLARNRLAVLRETNDGFVVAQRDLELRGPGELLGARQTGLPRYRIADLQRDAALLPQVQIAAQTILDEEMHVDSEAQASTAIMRRWIDNADRYSKV